ncbi:hypothetical protein [Sphingomonas trueperi]|uniref:Capsid assembly protein n=1 Tax=Sphingomonas trueperi TaxID=53317 RepID=A0A7X6BFE7_9SPHN|nr:hypothetical protein [Sphingomonas trueperi]NJB99871.1 hypothetical protein [Sphingomonas trueperi]
MTDLVEGAGEGGAGGDGGAGGAGGAPAGAAAPEWMASLPDELKGDATLSRYASLEELARGHVEARKVASSRVVLPSGDDDAAWSKFGETLRPADPSEYAIGLPEGVDPAGPAAKFADAFRAKAHEIGLPPRWAKALADWNNEFVAKDIAERNSASEAELKAFKGATPDYDAKLASAQGLFKSLGLDEAVVTELDVRLGTGNLMKLAFGLAEKFGEPVRVDPDGKGAGLGGGDASNAKDQIKEFDQANRDKIRAGDPDTMRARRKLLDAANAQAAR